MNYKHLILCATLLSQSTALLSKNIDELKDEIKAVENKIDNVNYIHATIVTGIAGLLGGLSFSIARGENEKVSNFAIITTVVVAGGIWWLGKRTAQDFTRSDKDKLDGLHAQINQELAILIAERSKK